MTNEKPYAPGRSAPRLGAIDLFAGAGGLSLGLKQAGFTLMGAVEADGLAAETYRYNHPEVALLEENILDVEPDRWREALGLRRGELALLAGCPPCQGFSSIRTRNKGTHQDDRNDLVFEFIRFVDEFQPRSVMFENVPGLANDSRFTTLVRRLRRRGYSVTTGVRNAADYSVPQRRHRLILLAIRGTRPRLADPASRVATVREAIGHLPPPSRGNDALHQVEKRSQRVMELIAAIPRDGGSRAALPANLVLACHLRSDGFKDVYGRMRWSSVAPTITGGCVNPSKGRFLHPDQDRAITLREAARLQSFPPKYHFSIRRGKYAAAEMIGNAFPPEFARQHAVILAQVLARPDRP